VIRGLTFTIDGAPRTKKNHGRRKYSFARKRTFNVPSEAYEEWERIARKSLPLIRQQIEDAGVGLPIAADLNCAAVIYRQADCGDAVGYYQGLADWLERAGVIGDDVQIRQWDGSRLKKDAKLPRIEVTLDELPPREKTPRAARGAKKARKDA
jgi:Holliday junction resolvase RusA-like endonuclease